MEKKFKSLLLMAFLSITLNACDTLQGRPDKAGMCKQLKHDIIFNGATFDKMQAQEERVDMNNLNRTYQQEGC